MYSFLFVAAIFVSILISDVNAQVNNCLKQCITPVNQLGACISIRQCPNLLALLPASRNNDTIQDYLRQSGCGLGEDGPKVCCPIGTAPFEETISNRFDFLSPDLMQCGNRTKNLRYGDPHFGQIAGGSQAKQGDWPWMTALGYRGSPPGNEPRWLCGGALITSKHVLTAAHCVSHKNDLYLVRLGEYDFGTDFDSAVDIEIRNSVVHENYSRRTRVADIAVIELKVHAPDNYAIHPICLPFSDDVMNRDFTTNIYQDYPWIAGWGASEYQGGASEVLQEVKIPVVTLKECRQAYSEFPKQIIDKRVICAGYKDGEKDACSGDSGGPLMWPKRTTSASGGLKTTYYVIGIVSYGYRCAEPGIPGVYTRVSEYLPWIRTKIQ